MPLLIESKAAWRQDVCSFLPYIDFSQPQYSCESFLRLAFWSPPSRYFVFDCEFSLFISLSLKLRPAILLDELVHSIQSVLFSEFSSHKRSHVALHKAKLLCSFIDICITQISSQNVLIHAPDNLPPLHPIHPSPHIPTVAFINALSSTLPCSTLKLPHLNSPAPSPTPRIWRSSTADQ